MDRTVVQPFGILDGIIPRTDFHKSSDKPYTHTPAAFCQERTAPASVPSIATTSAP